MGRGPGGCGPGPDLPSSRAADPVEGPSGRYTHRSAPESETVSDAPREGSPFRRGATVFENSTACALFDRPLGRDVCPGSTPSLDQPLGASADGARLTPSCVPGPWCTRTPREDAWA